jgi:peptidoglycan hydrolase-like protein with peptidoglycan-binding domain
VSLELEPAAGYLAVRRGLTKRIQAPLLRSGSRGRAVRFLEQRLEELRYVVRGVDRHFGSDTRDAVYAFQKIKGLPRNGVVGPRVWRRLLNAHIPKAAVPRGTHIEVDKSKQALFEVRKGKVVRVVHVSTGATGNTPLGRWRVYRKTAGFNVLHMYYSLYFHRGFAIHGYASVPPFPASHGCVRVPLWYARGLYSRWELGTPVYVFS